MSTLDATPAGSRLVGRIGERRLFVATVTTVLVVVLDQLTALTWFEVVAMAAVIAAPTVMFEGFWRALVWMHHDGIARLLWRRRQPGWAGRPVLWLAFASLWAADVLAATAFFHVPWATELNPLTVVLFQVAGEPGVLVAGLLYAGLVVAVTRRLSSPADVDTLFVVTLAYVLFALNNYGLLLGAFV